MTKRILPTPEELHQLLEYCPDTGKLYWKTRPEQMFATPRAYAIWNSRFPGTEAFTAIKGSGYYHGKIFGRPYLANRVIWAMNTGSWPSDQIDHINGDRLNNRMTNLRESSSAQNMRNQGARKTNKTGFKGVDFDKRAGKFRAQITVNWNKLFLGYHSCPEVAHAAYCEAAEKMHGEFARTE